MRNSAELTLVIMAAGMGSRFGGDKQLANLGPNGETMLELSLQSAYKAGFRRSVLVIRPELESTLSAQLAEVMPADFDYHFCYQKLNDLPVTVDISHRSKPWGTAHALYAARHLVEGPLAVINADDYYGDSAFTALVNGLSATDDWLMVAYPLNRTLSEFGGVNRGVCQVADEQLTSVAEWLDIRQESGVLKGELDGQRLEISKDAPVSMTCWGFKANIFPMLESALAEFANTSAHLEKSECFLPTVVQSAIDKGQVVRIAVAQDNWLGVTYPEDASWVKQKLMELAGE
ncbi:NTP transferase domain-containing protein [Shewanella submarina]|uniref:NDP-sugar synthase n=1 Tax=Shewanella submarina TaxID=2016376 RepID=A0ABV7GHN9_9GAMM|nr:NTP transferase domain-containing protein [Shewanella submarina]MCL1039862.1 NTP transferase domain-containing protein [Shewanella submarina]